MAVTATAVACHVLTFGHEPRGDRIMGNDKPLTMRDAGLLADIMRGVESGAKLLWYPDGADSADHPVTGTMRAITHSGGGFWPHDADVRDGYVHVSGIMEHWYPVREVMSALLNISGELGDTQPIAVIERL
jgi:hypothetical protein